ncbi:hypothetical protein MPP7335_05374 [Mycolicibacterium parafortuitum]|uniref:DUF4245 domain-containing protein n=2 Tax=Mycolicibacterium parafortuitum TaxID=39692 RepID=A0A375YRJ2_MYCPF|nr:hypothetical protein MPP7335_05374 [Mycolicibacterium parafortuitum]
MRVILPLAGSQSGAGILAGMTMPPEPGQPGAGDKDTTYTVPVAKPAKARLLQDGRDMFWSVGPLVVACVVLAGLLGMCSFAPQGPGVGPAPQYDAPAGLQADADALKIPIRVPQLPEGWQANSGSRKGIEAGRRDPVTGQPARAVGSVVGYLTPSGMYMSLTQSNADEDKLVASFSPELVPTGVQDVDGVRWVVYEGGERDGKLNEPVWTAEVPGPTGPAQLAVSGAGGTDEYRTLAAATQSQPPLTVT